MVFCDACHRGPVAKHQLAPARLARQYPQRAVEGCRAAAEAWEVFTTAESFACERPGVHHLLQEVYWLRWTINQVTFRGLAHNRWQPTTQVRQHVQRLFGGLGDTKLIEDSHKEIRSQEDEQTNQAINSQRVFHTLTRRLLSLHGDFLTWSCLRTIGSKSSQRNPTGSNTTIQKNNKLPKEWHCDNVLKPPRARGFVSKSPMGSRASIGAAQALTILFQEHRLDQAGLAWQSCTLSPRTLVGISESTTAMGVDVASTKWHLVLASAVWAALVWPVTRLHNGKRGADL